MADSISFIGAKTVRNQTGDQITLLRPKRGGDTHRVKSWWHKGRNAVYVDCALFNVALDSGANVQLAIPLQETTRVKFTSTGDGNFTWNKDFLGIDRAAVIDPTSGEVVVEYQFPKISGGSILKRVIGPIPSGTETTISSVTVTGNANPETNSAHEYTANVTGTASNLTYAWSATNGTVDDVLGNVALINWDGGAGVGRASVTVGSTDPNFDGDTVAAFIDVTVTEAFAARVAAANFTYAVTVDSGNYELDGVANAGIAGAPGDTFHFDLSDASNSGHPLKIYADAGKVTEVTVGVEQDGTDLLFTPPIAGTFYYQCENHADMGGQIVIS